MEFLFDLTRRMEKSAFYSFINYSIIKVKFDVISPIKLVMIGLPTCTAVLFTPEDVKSLSIYLSVYVLGNETSQWFPCLEEEEEDEKWVAGTFEMKAS